MFTRVSELWRYRKKAQRGGWRCIAGAIVFVAGRHSTDVAPPPPETKSQAISVYPRTTTANTLQPNRSANVATDPGILPAKAEVGRSEQLPLPDGNFTAKNSNTSTPAANEIAVNNALYAGSTGPQLELGSALQLAGVDNPTINIAREQIREALAQQLSAQVLLVPNLNVGGNYHYNNGPVQTSSGQILPVSDQALYMGFGAGAVGAGSVAYPGAWLTAHLGDAVYEPLAARAIVTARRAGSAATQNSVLGDVVTAYLRLVGSEARLDVLRRTEVEGAEVVRLTKEFEQAKQGRPADANRAQAFNNLVIRELHAAEEEVEVASAQLCRLLNVDPSIHLRSSGGTLEPFRLIPESTDAEALIAQAMQARPELVARAANIQEAQIRVRQEKVRPFLPTISVGVSSAGFGGESNLVPGGFSPLMSRTDIDAMAVWNVQNLGFGNRARVREANSVVGQALAEYDSTRNRIRSEVVDALAEARAAAQQLQIAHAAAINANEGYQLELTRIKGGGGARPNAIRPIELLDSFNELLESREALVAAITRFDIAQFRLFVAVGSNPLNGPDVSQAVPATVPDGPPAPLPMAPTPSTPSKP